MLRFETQPKRNHQPRLPVNRKAVTFDPEVKSLLAELLASELELWKLGTFFDEETAKKTIPKRILETSKSWRVKRGIFGVVLVWLLVLLVVVGCGCC